jgi:hypothetical protein
MDGWMGGWMDTNFRFREAIINNQFSCKVMTDDDRETIEESCLLRYKAV